MHQLNENSGQMASGLISLVPHQVLESWRVQQTAPTYTCKDAESLTKLKFYIPLETKLVTLEKFFLANLLASTEKTHRHDEV